MIDLGEETPWRRRIDPTGAMRVPGIVFGSRELLPDVIADRSLDQVANVASLPGIVDASYAMPNVHCGVRLLDRRRSCHRRRHWRRRVAR